MCSKEKESRVWGGVAWPVRAGVLGAPARALKKTG